MDYSITYDLCSALSSQISDLRGSLSSKSDKAKAELAQLQRQSEQELNKLKFDLAAATENHQRELEDLQKSLEREKEKLKEQQQEEMMVKFKILFCF